MHISITTVTLSLHQKEVDAAKVPVTRALNTSRGEVSQGVHVGTVEQGGAYEEEHEEGDGDVLGDGAHGVHVHVGGGGGGVT